MKTIFLNRQVERPVSCVATIGFFDGVHLGHRYIISKVVEYARREGLASMVVTFERHPRQVLHSDWCPQLLSTLDEKLEQLSQTGIDFLVVLQFDEAMASLSAHDFMHDILWQRLGVKVLVTGYDNRFGHNRTEGFDDYVRYGREIGMAVVQGDPIEVSSIRVSSSKVRRLLAEGLVEQAAECLGRPYMLSGRVVCGEHIGREMGFPTANLQLADDGKLIPASGVYAVKVKLEGAAELYHGMMNIGSRPTFGGQHQTLETHIFHFGGDIYGQQMTVLFVSRLRSEKRFDSREALMLQLESDLHQAEEKLAK
ncbi:MAG: bifunctional riboflavin kinase/FAD synthetase [Prevotella sp.]|nr:bifunctional riboflavin kinase/FAD synthetase [Prevotella sp.]